MKLHKTALVLARPMPWILSCLLMAAGAHAQEAGQPPARAGLPALKSGENTTGSEAYEKLLQDADRLIKSGKPDEAYALLEPLEFEHSGEERFDYLIGVAALDSGRPDKATLALERVLLVNPNSGAARLDMGRAYYQLGDMPRAKVEFETALQLNPSPAAHEIIQKYLESIDGQEAGKTHISGYVEGAIGHDNNVNNSTSQSQIFVDLVGANVALEPTNVKTSDDYYGVAAGGEISRSLDSMWGVYAGADLRQRRYSSQKDFDLFGLNARAGVTLGAKADRVRVGVVGGRYDLGGAHNSDASGVQAEWQHAFSPSNQLNAFIQGAKYRFADVQMQPNDFDQQAIGVGWRHVLPSGRSSLFGSLYCGAEQDISTIITAATPEGGRTDGAKQFKGLRFGGQTAFGERTTLFASGGVQTGDYSRVNFYFLRQRSDRLYDLTVGANWRWDKLWTLRPQLNYSRNVSNIEIYSYDRMDFSLTIRRDLR
ncbi:MAG TPA: tetratricopeptide repeat protein [Gallionellaceae bacterium]